MKLLILASACIVLASAGRLENNYLPPNSAGSAAGSRFLSAPGRSGFSGSAFSGSQSFSSSSSGQQIPIVKYNNDNNGDGQYRYSFETANHISAQEAGQAGDSSAVQGSYSYTGDDGQTYTINYVADENGYRPEGAHLPVAPPIPEEILKSLQQNAADEARGIVDDGSYNAAAHGGGSYSESGGSGYLSGVASNRGNFGSRSSGFSQQQQGGYKY